MVGRCPTKPNKGVQAMTWNSTEYKKYTTVSLDATADQQGAAFVALTAKALTTEIGRALLARDLHAKAWTISESAQAMGISGQTVSRDATKGEIIWHCGPRNVENAWQWLKKVSYGDASTSLMNAVIAAPEDQRANLVRETGTRAMIAKRLGDNATPERVDIVAHAMMTDGQNLPAQVERAIPGVCKRLDIPLPAPVKRGQSASNSADKKADVPTFDAAMRVALDAIAQVYIGADKDPIILTTGQAELLGDLAEAVARLMDEANVAV